MEKIYKILYLLILLPLLCSPAATLAKESKPKVKLGIEIEQGYSAPSIKNIDPNGLGAASGLRVHDKIKEISLVPVFFKYQVKNFLAIQKTDKPFTIVVMRKGALHAIKIDPSRSAKSWPKLKGNDFLSNCYFSPTQECIIKVINKPKKSNSPSSRFSDYISKVRRFIKLNRMDIARANLEKAKKEYYKIPKLLYEYGSLVELMHQFGQKFDRKILAYTKNKIGRRSNGKMDTSHLLGLVENLSEAGQADMAMPILMEVLNAAKVSPSLLKFAPHMVGKALAATDRHYLLKPLLKSKNYKSDWGSKMLQSAFFYYLRQDDLKSAEKIMRIVLTFPRSRTNKDDLIFIRMFKKVHQDKITFKLVERLEKQTEKASPLFKKLFARSLVKAYAARGTIHKARTTIDKYFKEDPLWPMIDTVIESANSRSAVGLAINYYRDLPKLITETHALLKKTGMKERKKNKRKIHEFYLILAAHHKSNFSVKEYEVYGFDSYEYRAMIESMVQARRHSMALHWVTAVEKKFNNDYKYYDVFTLYGNSAPYTEVEKLKRHRKYSSKGYFFQRAFLTRLYWRGRINDAVKLFANLSQKEKEIAVISQIPFTIKCSQCD